MSTPDVDVRSIATPTHGRVLIRRAQALPARGVVAGFHGYMENAAIMLPRLAEISGAAGWTLVSIQALHRFYRGSAQAVVASWMTREDREEAIADNLAYVDNALATVPDASSAAVVYVGFSQGASMACRAAVRGRSRGAGIIAVGGDVPPELLADSSAVFPPVLLVRGDTDEWYTAAKMDADVNALREHRVDVETLVHPGGHEWTPAVAEAAAAWLDRHGR
jgi:predicted esterase